MNQSPTAIAAAEQILGTCSCFTTAAATIIDEAIAKAKAPGDGELITALTRAHKFFTHLLTHLEAFGVGKTDDGSFIMKQCEAELNVIEGLLLSVVPVRLTATEIRSREAANDMRDAWAGAIAPIAEQIKKTLEGNGYVSESAKARDEFNAKKP